MDVSFVLDKDESHIHTGNETERRRPLKVGTINKATNCEQFSKTATSPLNHENKPGFSVKATKPVSYIVKGLRSRDFKDEQHNRMTIRASLPLP